MNEKYSWLVIPPLAMLVCFAAVVMVQAIMEDSRTPEQKAYVIMKRQADSDDAMRAARARLNREREAAGLSPVP